MNIYNRCPYCLWMKLYCFVFVNIFYFAIMLQRFHEMKYFDSLLFLLNYFWQKSVRLHFTIYTSQCSYVQWSLGKTRKTETSFIWYIQIHMNETVVFLIAAFHYSLYFRLYFHHFITAYTYQYITTVHKATMFACKWSVRRVILFSCLDTLAPPRFIFHIILLSLYIVRGFGIAIAKLTHIQIRLLFLTQISLLINLETLKSTIYKPNTNSTRSTLINCYKYRDNIPILSFPYVRCAIYAVVVHGIRCD